MSISSEIINLQDEYYRETATIVEAFCEVITDVELPDIVPPHIHKLREKLKGVPSVRCFDAAEARRKIREQFTGAATDRVKALLSNPEAVAALDTALEKIQ